MTYPGFPEGVSGYQFAENAYAQARRPGAEFVIGVGIKSGRPTADGILEVEFTSGARIQARSGVLATGVAYRRLDAPGFENLIGRGVRYGSAPGEAFEYRDQEVIVVGGANSAGQAAIHLANYARRVTMVVRANSLEKGMSQYLSDRIASNDRIDIKTNCQVARAEGASRLERVALAGSAAEETLPAQGMFVLIGADPITAGVAGWLQIDDRGYLLTGPDLLVHRDGPWWPLERDPPLFSNPASLASSSPATYARFDQTSRLSRGRRGDGCFAGPRISRHWLRLKT